MTCTEDRFLFDVEKHEMEILRDDGIYRHIKFKMPHSFCCAFELITWPGYLCICGDMGTYTFSRINDMFDFFTIKKSRWNKDQKIRINTGYWAEKLQSQNCHGVSTDGPKNYSEEKFKETIRRVYNDFINDYEMPDDEKTVLWQRLEDEVLSAYSEEQARQYASDFTHENFDLCDFWEYDLQEYTHHFIWILYAISWGIEKYKTGKGN